MKFVGLILVLFTFALLQGLSAIFICSRYYITAEPAAAEPAAAEPAAAEPADNGLGIIFVIVSLIVGALVMAVANSVHQKHTHLRTYAVLIGLSSFILFVISCVLLVYKESKESLKIPMYVIAGVLISLAFGVLYRSVYYETYERSQQSSRSSSETNLRSSDDSTGTIVGDSSETDLRSSNVSVGTGVGSRVISPVSPDSPYP
jgi:hypothetical protein